MPADAPFTNHRSIDAAPGALPVEAYRRISLTAWSAVMLGGAACWAALLYLI